MISSARRCSRTSAPDILITISGPPGSGTTTTAAQLAAAFGVELVLGGKVFRSMAVEHGMSLAEFGEYAAAQPAVDIELDRRLAERARQGEVIIESRLAGWLAFREQLPSLRVFLTCDDRVRAERVAARENIPVEQAQAENAQREKVEHDRYLALYAIDIDDLGVYDLILDTGRLSADEVTARVVAGFHAAG